MCVAILIFLLCLVFFAWVVHCIVWVFDPIRRDQVIAEKEDRFLVGVLLFVIAVPLFISTLIISLNNFGCLDVHANDIFVQNSESYNPASNHSIFWTIYFHYIDPGNQSNATEKGNIWVIVVSMLGLFLINGLLVTTILNWIDQRKEQRQTGKIRYTRKAFGSKKFAVVIGANEVASSVIKNLLLPKEGSSLNNLSDKNNDYVVLQTSSDVAKVREVLSSHLSQQEMDRVIIYNALRDSKAEIQQLHLEKATEIYILGENTTIDGGETYHDAMNMRCLNLIAEELKPIQEKDPNAYYRKVCRVMFDYQTTHSVFQFSNMSDTVSKTLVFIPFNRYESWARKVLVDCVSKDCEYVPLDGYDGIKYDDDKRVHFVIVGMSKMGIAMGVQALLQLHFPNYVKDKSLKSRITFIDANADKEMAFFKGRYATLFELARYRYINANECSNSELNDPIYGWIDPMEFTDCKWKHLSETGENFIDVEIEFIKGELESDGVRSYLREITQEGLNTKLTIAICLTQTHQSVAAALYMPTEVYESNNLQQVLVYQREASDIVNNLLNVKDTSIRYKKLRPFGMLYDEYMEMRRRYYKAQLVNMAYSNAHENIPWPTDVLNKKDRGVIFMRKAWSQLQISLQISNKYFGDTIYQKLRSMMDLPEGHAIGGYQNAIYSNALLCDELNSVLHLNIPSHDVQDDADAIAEIYKQYKDKPAYVLAQCEHNRWNIEKLLMGYAPMNAKQNGKFMSFVKEKKNAELKKYKAELKSSAANIHPNICDFSHLKTTDPGAQWYDVMLHNGIPYILLLVDGYKTQALNAMLHLYSQERIEKENVHLQKSINE